MGILAVSLASAAAAQPGSAGLTFLKFGVGARALGMGDAYSAIADDPSATYYNPASLSLAKAPKMPVFMAQGDKDALVPVESARTFQQAAKTEGRDLVYIEKAGTDHLQIVDQVMKDVFDFFDAHRRAN